MANINPAKLLEDDYSGDWQKDMPDLFKILNKTNTDASRAIDSTMTLKNLGAQKIFLQSVVVPDDKINMALATGWTSGSGGAVNPYYQWDANGIVICFGTATGGSATSTIVTGAPKPVNSTAICCSANGAFAKVVVYSDGSIKHQVGSTTNVEFSTVFYRATQPYVPSCFPIKIASQIKTGQAGLVLCGLITDLNKAGKQTVIRLAQNSVAWHNETGFSGDRASTVNNIVIDNITGLLPGHTYNITLWAIPDAL